MRKLKVVSLFSGIGAYEKALTNLGIPFEIRAFCEIDPHAAHCYSVIHGIPANAQKNLHDVSRLRYFCNFDFLDFDLLTFSPPCQDISIAGQHAGVGEDTRSGLMWQVIDLIRTKKPKYLLMENVKTLAGKYKQSLDTFVKHLKMLGYDCSYAVLNAKDYGMPQNRQRLFMVGIHDNLGHQFRMPAKQPLTKHLKDYLDVPVKTIDKEIAYTVRVGGRKSKIGNKHNWDGYFVNGKPHYLSAKECLKLMGFDDEDYEKLKAAQISESRIAKVAGNSIVVTVLECILRQLLL